MDSNDNQMNVANIFAIVGNMFAIVELLDMLYVNDFATKINKNAIGC